MQATLSPSRIPVVDALRGFAVMAIFWIHCVEHFIFPVYPDPASQPDWLNQIDQGVFQVIFALFSGKSYSIFALLFGFTFYIQFENQRQKGIDFGYRFLWRMVLLVGFATLNAAFFPGGDVLLLFAVVSIVLFALRKCGDRVVLGVAILFLIQPVEWFHYAMYLADADYQLPDLGVGAMYNEVAAYTKEGTFWEFISGNCTVGQKASLFWAIGAGRISQTAGLFLLGLFVGCKQLFVDTERNGAFWQRCLIVSSLHFGVIYPLKVSLYDQMDDEMIKQTVGVVFDMWQKLMFTGVLVSAFLLLSRQERFQRYTHSLRYYGRMSMTNYIAQSIVGALVFFPFGLYLAPYCGYALSLFIAIVLSFVQLKFSIYWLNSHKQGPLEWLWHKLTWLKLNK